jgi:phage terminase large subunit-like protein
VSSDADLQEGVNAHGVVADELHAHKNRGLYDTLRSATIGREEPMFVSITTAGVDLDTICGEVYTRGAGPRPQIRAGVFQARPDKQRSFYFHWRQVDEKKLEDRKSWRQANPLSTLTLERLEDESSIERPRSIFARYHLNAWMRVEKHLFPIGLVEKCVDRKRTLARGDEIVVAVDVGLMHDTFAVGWCGTVKPYPFRGYAWGIWPDPKKPPPPAHDVTEGDGPLDFEVVETFILEELAAAYRIRVVRFDPYKFARSAEILSKAGLEVRAFEQTHTSMVPASEGLFRLVKKREVALANDSVVLAHFDAAAARDIGSGRWRLDKRNAKRVMDLTITAAMATATADEPPPPKPSFDVL